MTLCYWGGYRGGKKQMQWLMTYNQKKFCIVLDHSFSIHDNKCHWMGFVNKISDKKRISRSWEYTSNITKYYYKEGEDELCTATNSRRFLCNIFDRDLRFKEKAVKARINSQIYKGKKFKPPVGNIRDDAKQGYAQMNVDNKTFSIYNYKLNKNIGFDDDSLLKYLDSKYDGTMLQWKAVSHITEPYRGNGSKLMYGAKWYTTELPFIKIKDIPDCHLVIPHSYHGNGSFHEFNMSAEWNKFKNIVPYKSNLVDSAVSAMYLWRETHGYEESNPCINWYQTNKQDLWNHLYKMVFEYYYTVPKRLKDHGIQFEYFDLDKGSYRETFEVPKEFGGFRLMTYYYLNEMKQAENKTEARRDYGIYREIAKEFLEYMGNPKDNREYVKQP